VSPTLQGGFAIITESWKMDETPNDKDLWCPECGTKLIGSNVTNKGVCKSCLRTARWKPHTVNDGGVPPQQIPAWTFYTENLSFTIVEHSTWWSLHCPWLDLDEELDIDGLTLGEAQAKSVEIVRAVLAKRLAHFQAAIEELAL
jgi:hypothetical protein